jgi:hypothetical protein
MLDRILDFVVVLLPTIISAVGVYVSMKAPEAKHRKHWIAGLLLFGIMLSALTYWQQDRSRQRDESARKQLEKTLQDTQQALQDTRFDNAKSISFLSGQVSALGGLIANPPRSKDLQGIAAAITHASRSAGPQYVSNQQLRDAAMDLARRLRDFQLQIHGETERLFEDFRNRRVAATGNKEESAKLSHEQQSYTSTLYMRQMAAFGPLRAEALNMRTQLLSRLPPQPENVLAKMTLDYGTLAGVAPAYELATWIESLARLLPTTQ